MQYTSYLEMFSQEDTHFWFVGKRLFIQTALVGVAGAKILDVGAGTGGTTAFLSRFGKVTGIEPNRHARTLATKRGLTLRPGSANRLPFPNQTFDVVTLFDVLYHQRVDEHRALSEAYRVLRPGGILCITDCAVPWLMNRHDVIMEAKYRYTQTQLAGFVEGAGFIVDRCHYIFTSIFPLVVLSRVLLSPPTITTPPAPINQALTTLLRIEASLPRWFPRPFGSSILIVAHKP